MRRWMYRAKIKEALVKHGQNITDCILSFNVSVTSIYMGILLILL